MQGGASVTLGADEAQGRVFFSAPKGDGWGSRGEEGLATGTGHSLSNGAYNIYYVKFTNYRYGSAPALPV